MKVLRCVLLAACVSGCAGWTRVESLEPDSLPPGQDVQVWTGRKARVLHGVTIGQDSIRGIPFQLPLSCDTCRVAVPLAAVDSVRVGSEAQNGFLWVAGVGGVLLVIAAIIEGLKSNYP